MIHKGNNYAFIDGQNLYMSISHQGWNLDYRRFIIYLKEKYKVLKAFLFLGYIAGNESLYKMLRNCGYVLIFKPILRYGDKIKANIDAELVLHTMIEFFNFEKAIIVTGDGDFYCLIDYLRRKDKLHCLFVPNKNKYSSLLKRFIDNIIFLNTLKNRLKYKK